MPSTFPWLQRSVALVAAAVLVNACDDAQDDRRVQRDLGGGLVLTSEGRVVEAMSLPGAVLEDDAVFWRSLKFDFPSMPIAFGLDRSPARRWDPAGWAGAWRPE